MPWTARRAGFVLASTLLPVALAACGSSASGDGGGGSGSKVNAGASVGDPGGKDPDTLHYAEIPSENATEQAKANKALFDLLAKETGKKIEVVNVTSYAAAIESQRAGKSDIVSYGPDSWVTAEKSGVKAELVGVTVDTKGGKDTYQSYGIVPKNSPIKTLADFKGKKVCFVDPTSTSGYLYPVAGLAKVGIDAKKDIKPIMAGGHDSSALAVKSGQCDAGFAYDRMVDSILPKAGKIKSGDLRIVFKSDPIPNSPVAISSDLAPALKTKIIDTFTQKANTDFMMAHGFCTEAASCLPDGSFGYVPVTDKTYDIVRQVCTAAKDESCAG